MKKIIASFLSYLLIVAFTLSVGCQKAPEKPAEQKAAAPAKAEEKKPAEKKAPAIIKHVIGEVVAVDAKAKTLTIKEKKGDIAFSVDEKAAAKLAGVKTGDKVTVMYKEMDGKNMATSVAKKPAEKKEAAPAALKAEEKKPAAPAEKKKTGGY